MDVSIPRTIDAYHTYADEKGRADARAAHKTSDPLMYTRLVQVEMERDTLLATLEANQEDTNHVEKFKQEILHLKMVGNNINSMVACGTVCGTVCGTCVCGTLCGTLCGTVCGTCVWHCL